MTRALPLPDLSKKIVGVSVVVGVGAGLLAVHITHVLGRGENLQTFVLGILFPMSLTVGILVGGVWLGRTDDDGEYVLTVAGWCVVGCGVGTVSALLLVLHQWVKGVVTIDPLYIFANEATGGAAAGFLVGVYDVRRRRARAQTARVNRQLTVINRVLRHDIRNSANVIHGRLDHLSRTNGNGSANGNPDQVEPIRKRADHLVELGNHAGQIERLVRGSDERLTTVDIGAVLETQLDRLADEYPTAEVRSSVRTDAVVRGHPLVESAIANVLENALEHNDRDSPRIEVDCERVTRGGTEYVEIRVADDGPGIPDEAVQILERGYETSLEHTKGLGLWIVNWIVTASDGDVRFEENGFGGSTVRLRFEPAGSDSITGQDLIQRLSAAD